MPEPCRLTRLPASRSPGRWWRTLAAALVALALAGTALTARAFDDMGAQHFARDVVRSGDAGGRAFAIVDKPAATVWVYDRRGRLVGRSVVLVGQAVGDRAPPDIGSRPLRQVRPQEKITAAGRYVTEAGRNAQGEDIVWLDYDAALSMHRVRHVPGEHRPERLRTPGVADKRISFGCINVPERFYDRTIDPLFARTPGVVYVLPESAPIERWFPFARGITTPDS